VRYFDSVAASGWLSDKRTRDGDVVKTAKLRCNLWPTKTCLGQARKLENVKCRLCNRTAETVGHISGHCNQMKEARIARHNWVVNTLTRDLRGQRIKYAVEPTFRLPSSTNAEVLKPDIVVLPKPAKDESKTAYILDPTLVFENGRSLHNAYSNKRQKYWPLIDKIKRTYKVDRVIISGIVIGARGGWLDSNEAALKKIGIGNTAYVIGSTYQ